MDNVKKNALTALYLIILCSLSGGTGVAVWLSFPFGWASFFVGLFFILASIAFWGWACIGHKFI
ncbi:hypothetical protein MUP01_09145 [Candidatus Bathyarchaeota archaeon]|nr:hypothetical protein [Candidatus Bathyarchaeota archaeon]